MDVINVVDTAVKIGLGALITASASYFTTRANHQNERRKESRAHRIKTIELVAESTERTFHAFSNYTNHVQGLTEQPGRDTETPLTERDRAFLKQPDDELFVAIEHIITARSRLNLLRAEEANLALKQVINRLSDMRNYIDRGKLPSKADFDSFLKVTNNDIHAFEKTLASLYSANSD